MIRFCALLLAAISVIGTVYCFFFFPFVFFCGVGLIAFGIVIGLVGILIEGVLK